ncbi:MAG: protein kinase [Cyanobacteria bacterium HKST-UBA02]|nr:protein kinase [Cyanobacteria bacterium HKST-UBA02]
MSDKSDDERCPRCGGVKTLAGRSHSLTQWIEACNCAILDAAEKEGQELISICADCGKRAAAGRAGSFTQWIFRMDLCSCPVPRPRLQPAGTLEPVETEVLAETENYEDAGVEIEVDPDRFPVDRFRPLSVIGRGSTGTVYYCSDRLLNKDVAVKVLNRQSDEDLVAFQREAKTTSNLNHPNIVQVLDFGVTGGGVPFMAMEFVDGVSLDLVLAERKVLGLRQALEIFHQVCQGISYAHGEGVLHRDLKSSNILLSGLDSGNPDVRIIDFGVALGKYSSDGAIIAGTPAYMPPDQALGRSYDERSEVYGIGCTFFEALTGRPPFSGDTALDTMRRHAEEHPPSLAEASVTGQVFPDSLESIAACCLEKDGDDRFTSVSQLDQAILSALQEIVESEKPAVTPVTQHVWTFISEEGWRSGRFWAILATFLVVAIVSGAYLVNRSVAITERKAHKDVSESDLALTPLTSLVSTAIEPHFSDIGEVKGQSRLLAKEGVTDRQLEELSGRHDIYSVIINGDPITARGLAAIADCGIVDLKITNVKVGDEAVPVLASMKDLRALDMMGTNITSGGIKDLLSRTSLDELHIGGDLVDDSAIQAVASTPSLKGLEISKAPGVSEKSLTKLAALPELRILGLDAIEFGSRMLGALKGFPALQELSLSRIDLSRELLKGVTGLNLTGLEIARTDLDDSQLEKIVSMKSLRSLTLKLCGTSDRQLKIIARAGKLERLSIVSPELSGSGLEALPPGLQKLDLRRSFKVSTAKLQAFRQSHPGCRVIFSGGDDLKGQVDGLSKALFDSLDSGRNLRKYW